MRARSIPYTSKRKRRDLRADGLQIFSAHLNGRMLVDAFKAQHEAIATTAPDKRSLHTLKNPTLDPNLLADDKLAVGLGETSRNTCTKSLDVGIGNRDALAPVADDLEHSGRLKDTDTLANIDMDEEVGGKQRQGGLDALTVLPYPNGFVGREKRLNLAHPKLAHDRFLVLRDGKNRKPATLSELIPCLAGDEV
jgi:hypothetical protein